LKSILGWIKCRVVDLKLLRSNLFEIEILRINMFLLKIPFGCRNFGGEMVDCNSVILVWFASKNRWFEVVLDAKKFFETSKEG